MKLNKTGNLCAFAFAVQLPEKTGNQQEKDRKKPETIRSNQKPKQLIVNVNSENKNKNRNTGNHDEKLILNSKKSYGS